MVLASGYVEDNSLKASAVTQAQAIVEKRLYGFRLPDPFEC